MFNPSQCRFDFHVIECLQAFYPETLPALFPAHRLFTEYPAGSEAGERERASKRAGEREIERERELALVNILTEISPY